MSWEIGKHGLRLAFSQKGRRYGSTYLPSVAEEQGWTKDETLLSLMRKAGWKGDDWHDVDDLKVTRYQGLVVHTHYDDFSRFREWVDTQKTS